MTVALLGNNSPMMQVTRHVVDPDTLEVTSEQISVRAAHLEQSVTRFEVVEEALDSDFVEHTLSTDNDPELDDIVRIVADEHRPYAVGIQQVKQAFTVHANGTRPAWVASEDEGFEAALADYFRCPRGEPTMLQTTFGRDGLHAQHYGTAAQPAAFNYVGLTANNTAANASNVTLPGEIVGAGAGLIRKQGTYAHTAGTNTTTLTTTFTANGTDALPVTPAKAGIHNALTGTGTMGYETLMNAPTTLNISGDSFTLTSTLLAG